MSSPTTKPTLHTTRQEPSPPSHVVSVDMQTPASAWADPAVDAVVQSDHSHGTPTPHMNSGSPVAAIAASDRASAGDTAIDPLALFSAWSDQLVVGPSFPTDLADGIATAEPENSDTISNGEPVASAADVESVPAMPESNSLEQIERPQPIVEPERPIGDATDHVIGPGVDEFASQATTEAEHPRFMANWEVDLFEVPPAVSELFFDGQLQSQLSSRLSETVHGGLRTMLVTAGGAGEGSSTVAMGIALSAASGGLRVALVDADLDHPSLADDLRLDIESSWTDCFHSSTPLAESAVTAIQDGVTLFPQLAAGWSSAPFGGDEVAALIERLLPDFDLVVVDGGSSAADWIHRAASAIDSAIVVRDMTRTRPETVNQFAHSLAHAGVRGIGVVENFAAG